MNSAGLFVDYENTFISLVNNEPRSLKHEVLADHLTKLAQSRGELVFRIVWADWDRFPGAQRIFATKGFDTRFVPASVSGSNETDLAMRAELRRILEGDDAPDIFVIATGSRNSVGAVDELIRSGKKVVLLGDEPSAERLGSAVDSFVLLNSGIPPEDFQVDSDGSPERVTLQETGGSLQFGSEQEVLAAIRRVLACTLEERHIPWLSYRLFSNRLVSVGVTSYEHTHFWLDRAVEEGYVIREEERGAVKRFCKFTPGPRSGEGDEGASVIYPESAPARPSNRGRDAASWSAGGVRWPEQHREAGFDSGRAFPGGKRIGWSQDWRNFTFVRILWSLRAHLEGKPSRFYLNPASLLDALRREGIGYSEEEIFFWVNQSVDRGILTREVKEASIPGAQRFYRYYLNFNNRFVVLAEEVPRAILQTVNNILETRTEWNGIAFNFLIKLLQVHPVLSNPTHEFHTHRIREWINFLIDEGILVKFEEPDLREPTRTTTMVASNPDHAQTQRFLRDVCNAPFYYPEHQALLRTILTIDHFLYWLWTKSPDEDWLPLMTLKSWLRNSLGDQLTKWAISECESKGIFKIERYKNKGGLEATVAGVRLQYENEFVAQTLERRDEFVRLLIGLLRNRATIPYGLIEQRLREHPGFGDTPDEKLGWIALMTDSKIITIERDSSQGEMLEQSFVCRLNAREKFVGELLTRVMRGGRRPTSSDVSESMAGAGTSSLFARDSNGLSPGEFQYSIQDMVSDDADVSEE